RAGFSIVDTLTTVPVEWFALHGLNYVKRPALGAVVHWLRMLLEWHALTFVPSWTGRQRALVERWSYGCKRVGLDRRR
ncbi:MAG: hypothetical protein ACYSTI_14545, partial [Planctomycetota bacterium]